MNAIDGDTKKQQAVIRIVKQNPGATWRAIATQAGVSLGCVQYALRERDGLRGLQVALAREQPTGRHYDGSKRLAVEKAFERTPNKNCKWIAAEVGCSTGYAHTVIDLLKLKLRLIEEAKEPPAEVPITVPAIVHPVAFTGSDLEVRRDHWAVESQQANARTRDAAALRGTGPTTGQWDTRILGVLNGAVSQTIGMLNDINNARTQASWGERARAMAYHANFIECDLAPLARQGMYRGMPGDAYFSKLAAYLRSRVEQGPLG